MSPDRSLPASREELRERGRRARTRTPRRDLAAHSTAPRDPLGILAAQNAQRVPELVPLREERMAASPFAFYRGTAALMAADLADAPDSGILVASCGDAHVSNFGFYASAQRDLMFDLNDFDEAAWAPWEWDVKRLVTSAVVGGQASGRADGVIEAAVRAAVTTYARGIRGNAALSPTERYFTHFDVDSTRTMLDERAQRAVRKSIKQAQRRTGERAVGRLTRVDDGGRRRFVHELPETAPVDDRLHELVSALVDDYRRSANADVGMLFQHYSVSDIARRVVGVGSVGTRCYLVLLQDGDDHTLLMQPKEAGRSVLVEYGRVEQPRALQRLIDASGEGARVVAMQRILQALSDPFLGHVRSPRADFYVRQFHDMKGGVEVEGLDDAPFITYAQACAGILARAHSQSVTAASVDGYIGGGRAVTDALLDWAYGYAAVSLADYREFVAARHGAVP